jgi:hypothetical protein
MLSDTLATVLLVEGADLDDEFDCLLAIAGHEPRPWKARDVAGELEAAIAKARVLRVAAPAATASRGLGGRQH